MKNKTLSSKHKENIGNSLRGRVTPLEIIKKISKAKMGHKVTKETRLKISNSKKGKVSNFKGKKHTQETKYKISQLKIGIPSPNRGKKLLKEHRRKLSIARRKNDGHKGKNSYLWKGGISFEPYGLEFNNKLREQIRKRDNHRCQECFRHQDELYTKSGRKYRLHIHHINYNKKNNSRDNLISLCKSCHAQTNFRRSDWIEYFQTKSYA